MTPTCTATHNIVYNLRNFEELSVKMTIFSIEGTQQANRKGRDDPCQKRGCNVKVSKISNNNIIITMDNLIEKLLI